MNCYFFWKYIIVVMVLVFGFIYILFNFFGELLVVQVFSVKVMIKVDDKVKSCVEEVFQVVGIVYDGIQFDIVGVKVCFVNIDIQLKVKDVFEKVFNLDVENL